MSVSSDIFSSLRFRDFNKADINNFSTRSNEKCSECDDRSKIYCFTCRQTFCERCFLSKHLFQFHHKSIVLPNWEGHHETCEKSQRSHFFLHCLTCDEVFI